jgi:phosphoribosylanthranilate isomerase
MKCEIKFCGMTNREDVQAALALGADYVGFVFYAASKRAVTVDRVKRILAKAGREVRAVGVFVNAAREEVLRTAEQCGLYAVQLHGDEDPAEFAGMDVRLWRALRVGPKGPKPSPEDWRAERYVVDAAVPGIYGGTGLKADWRQAADLTRRKPVILAGGLTPENVAQAIRQVGPMGVDVVSGVEAEPCRKDHLKMKRFVEAVRGAEEELRA